mgnify:CR=1 FL=1
MIKNKEEVIAFAAYILHTFFTDNNIESLINAMSDEIVWMDWRLQEEFVSYQD